MKRKNILIVLTALAIGFLIYVVVSNLTGFPAFNKKSVLTYAPVEEGMVGQLIPSFDILLPDSVTYVNVQSTSEGMSTVLFYFGPECPYCQQQMKEIIKGMGDFNGVQFYILTLYPLKDIVDFYREFKLDKYPNIKVGTDYKYFFGQYFKTQSFPFLAVYGKNKKLKGAYMGVLPIDQLRNVVLE